MVTMNIAAWDVMLIKLLAIYQPFGVTYCLYLPRRWLQWVTWKRLQISYRTTQHHIAQRVNLQSFWPLYLWFGVSYCARRI
jgi:hypothetical protein